MHETDLSRLDLNLLALFDTIRREGHVGRAADRLNLSPSAVSHGLARLRRMFDDPLFLRTPKGVVPTARAEEMAPAVAEIQAAVARLPATDRIALFHWLENTDVVRAEQLTEAIYQGLGRNVDEYACILARDRASMSASCGASSSERSG